MTTSQRTHFYLVTIESGGRVWQEEVSGENVRSARQWQELNLDAGERLLRVEHATTCPCRS